MRRSSITLALVMARHIARWRLGPAARKWSIVEERRTNTPTAVAGVSGGNPAAACSARRWPMLRLSALTPAQQREVRRWQLGGDPHLARRAQVVLWSARGWSVPALAHALGCCRRTVRRWVHAFLDAGLTGLLGRLVERGSVRGSTADSAIGSDPPATDDRLVPVVPISVPERSRIRSFHSPPDPVSPACSC